MIFTMSKQGGIAKKYKKGVEVLMYYFSCNILALSENFVRMLSEEKGTPYSKQTLYLKYK